MLYYYDDPNAQWLPDLDYTSGMTTAFQDTLVAVGELQHILTEIDNERLGRDVFDPSLPSSLLQHSSSSSDVLKEIPREDIIYRSQSTELIKHGRFANMCLLEFRTFSGALAYQPCSKDIDLMGLFNSLHPLDKDGDPLFKDACAWSCVMQAQRGLPKDIRFVLATIYNFAIEMLHPDQDANTFWSFRPWLQWWYDLADRLFSHYRILGSAPDPDWFMRPTGITVDDSTPAGILAIISRCQRGSDVSQRRQDFADWSSQSPSSNSLEGSEESSDEPRSTIQAWIDAQSAARNAVASSSQHRPPTSAVLASESSLNSWSLSPSLNPLAIDFVPATGQLASKDGEVGERQKRVDDSYSETVYTERCDSSSSTSSRPALLDSSWLDSTKVDTSRLGFVDGNSSWT